MSRYESMMQMLQRRFSLKTKAVIYRKSNEFLKTQIVSCSQIRAKRAVIRGGVRMIEVLQTEVIGEGALSSEGRQKGISVGVSGLVIFREC